MRDIKHIVIHCTATAKSATIEAIKNYWRNTLKWRSNGYHFIIDTKGQVTQITPLDNLANGVKGYNENSIHVSYIGGIDAKGKPKDTRTEAQKKAMRNIVDELGAKYPNAKILGHRDFPNVAKACPSFDVAKWLAMFVLVLGLSSCSTNWHLKRAMIKDPDLLKPQTVLFDTLIITKDRVISDTVIMNEVDSFTIYKDNVITNVWRNFDTISVKTICPGDTVIIEMYKECPPQLTVNKANWVQRNWFVPYVALVLLFAGILFVERRYN